MPSAQGLAPVFEGTAIGSGVSTSIKDKQTKFDVLETERDAFNELREYSHLFDSYKPSADKRSDNQLRRMPPIKTFKEYLDFMSGKREPVAWNCLDSETLKNKFDKIPQKDPDVEYSFKEIGKYVEDGFGVTESKDTTTESRFWLRQQIAQYSPIYRTKLINAVSDYLEKHYTTKSVLAETLGAELRNKVCPHTRMIWQDSHALFWLSKSLECLHTKNEKGKSMFETASEVISLKTTNSAAYRMYYELLVDVANSSRLHLFNNYDSFVKRAEEIEKITGMHIDEATDFFNEMCEDPERWFYHSISYSRVVNCCRLDIQNASRTYPELAPIARAVFFLVNMFQTNITMEHASHHELEAELNNTIRILSEMALRQEQLYAPLPAGDEFKSSILSRAYQEVNSGDANLMSIVNESIDDSLFKISLLISRADAIFKDDTQKFSADLLAGSTGEAEALDVCLKDMKQAITEVRETRFKLDRKMKSQLKRIEKLIVVRLDVEVFTMHKELLKLLEKKLKEKEDEFQEIRTELGDRFKTGDQHFQTLYDLVFFECTKETLSGAKAVVSCYGRIHKFLMPHQTFGPLVDELNPVVLLKEVDSKPFIRAKEIFDYALFKFKNREALRLAPEEIPLVGMQRDITISVTDGSLPARLFRILKELCDLHDSVDKGVHEQLVSEISNWARFVFGLIQVIGGSSTYASRNMLISGYVDTMLVFHCGDTDLTDYNHTLVRLSKRVDTELGSKKTYGIFKLDKKEEIATANSSRLLRVSAPAVHTSDSKQAWVATEQPSKTSLLECLSRIVTYEQLSAERLLSHKQKVDVAFYRTTLKEALDRNDEYKSFVKSYSFRTSLVSTVVITLSDSGDEEDRPDGETLSLLEKQEFAYASTDSDEIVYVMCILCTDFNVYLEKQASACKFLAAYAQNVIADYTPSTMAMLPLWLGTITQVTRQLSSNLGVVTGCISTGATVAVTALLSSWYSYRFVYRGRRSFFSVFLEEFKKQCWSVGVWFLIGLGIKVAVASTGFGLGVSILGLFGTSIIEHIFNALGWIFETIYKYIGIDFLSQGSIVCTSIVSLVCSFIQTWVTHFTNTKEGDGSWKDLIYRVVGYIKTISSTLATTAIGYHVTGQALNEAYESMANKHARVTAVASDAAEDIELSKRGVLIVREELREQTKLCSKIVEELDIKTHQVGESSHPVVNVPVSSPAPLPAENPQSAPAPSVPQKRTGEGVTVEVDDSVDDDVFHEANDKPEDPSTETPKEEGNAKQETLYEEAERLFKERMADIEKENLARQQAAASAPSAPSAPVPPDNVLTEEPVVIPPAPPAPPAMAPSAPPAPPAPPAMAPNPPIVNHPIDLEIAPPTASRDRLDIPIEEPVVVPSEPPTAGSTVSPELQAQIDKIRTLEESLQDFEVQDKETTKILGEVLDDYTTAQKVAKKTVMATTFFKAAMDIADSRPFGDAVNNAASSFSDSINGVTPEILAYKGLINYASYAGGWVTAGTLSFMSPNVRAVIGGLEDSLSFDAGYKGRFDTSAECDVKTGKCPVFNNRYAVFDSEKTNDSGFFQGLGERAGLYGESLVAIPVKETDGVASLDADNIAKGKLHVIDGKIQFQEVHDKPTRSPEEGLNLLKSQPIHHYDRGIITPEASTYLLEKTNLSRTTISNIEKSPLLVGVFKQGDKNVAIFRNVKTRGKDLSDGVKRFLKSHITGDALGIIAELLEQKNITPEDLDRITEADSRESILDQIYRYFNGGKSYGRASRRSILLEAIIRGVLLGAIEVYFRIRANALKSKLAEFFSGKKGKKGVCDWLIWAIEGIVSGLERASDYTDKLYMAQLALGEKGWWLGTIRALAWVVRIIGKNHITRFLKFIVYKYYEIDLMTEHNLITGESNTEKMWKKLKNWALHADPSEILRALWDFLPSRKSLPESIRSAANDLAECIEWLQTAIKLNDPNARQLVISAIKNIADYCSRMESAIQRRMIRQDVARETVVGMEIECKNMISYLTQ